MVPLSPKDCLNPKVQFFPVKGDATFVAHPALHYTFSIGVKTSGSIFFENLHPQIISDKSEKSGLDVHSKERRPTSLFREVVISHEGMIPQIRFSALHRHPGETPAAPITR